MILHETSHHECGNWQPLRMVKEPHEDCFISLLCSVSLSWEESDKLPLGVFYANPNKPTFEESTGVYRVNKDPVCMRTLDKERLARLIESRTGV
jgi:hypothetical protein